MDVCSNHASPGSSFVWWVCKPVLPRHRNAPLGKDVQRQMHQVHKPTDRVSHFKGHQGSACPVRLAVTGFGMEFTLHRWVRVRGSCWTLIPSRKGPVIFPVLHDTCIAGPENEAKTKARQRPIQRRIAKGNERRHTHQWRKTEMDRE